MYAPSTDSVVRRGMPLMPLHYPIPPSYINPPSFEDSMKQKYVHQREEKGWEKREKAKGNRESEWKTEDDGVII